MRRLVAFGAVLVFAAASVVAQTGSRPFTINELLVLRRVGDPQLSPDGRTVAFTITDTDKAANRRTTQIYLMPAEGGEPRQLTKETSSSASPRWSPDGRLLAFTRGGQIWTLNVATGETKQVTTLSTGADGPVWSPDGKWLAFVSTVYPECADDECNKRRAQQVSESKVKAKVIDRLLFRHWTTWQDGMRSHVFVVPSAGGAARDLTPGDWDAPPFSLGGPPDYAFSPDSPELAFARNTDKVEATSTNADIWTVPVAGGEARNLTAANRAADLSPQYTPDGRYLAYRAQVRPGFESDRWRLMLYDRRTRQTRSVTEAFDAHVDGFTFTRDGSTVYFVAGERGRQPVFRLSLADGRVQKIISGVGMNDEVQVSPDGRTLVFTRNTASRPSEIFRASADGSNVTQLTRVNEATLADHYLPAPEELTWEGAEGAQVHGFLFKPINFNPSRKHPLVVLIHGGPQGAWNDAWSYRWNPQIFASQGYVVFLPNPRGSTTYGQKFTDEISGDWAGKVFTDLRNGIATVAAYPYVDKERIGGAGASYGGYMVNWFAGHNDDPRFRFRTLVSHAGVFNLTSMAGVTEELWFTTWEFKGMPWENPEMYARWSPHLFVKNFKTPMLVIHGELDFRVPVGEGFQLFTALQMMGVESKLLYFPDEGHWILKPQNSELWHNTVIDWLAKYLKDNRQETSKQ
ncbi:MAG TPA: S9 family peptidase [Pyrinomonadaceae bacterium]|nr:S9 family peptidase [Pyrinomonadaceae bacterium]